MISYRLLVSLGIFLCLTLSSQFNTALAHEFDSEMRYLGNEGVMVSEGNNKILFDPFFHNNFGIYTLVPADIKKAIFAGKTPYDNISAIFISHAHDDHFSAEDVLTFLKAHKQAKLVAPQQAIEKIMVLPDSAQIKSRLFSIKLGYADKAESFSIGSIHIEAVRIPHAGWPGRAELENIVFRLTLDDKITVMHLGDADPDDNHFSPHNSFWQQNITDHAFPPYWFMLSDEGNNILNNRINTKNSIGIHVPTNVPNELKKSGKDYFSKPGETRTLKGQH